jgi:hypothetical protein
MAGGSHPRFAPSELNLDKSLRARRRAALLYRHVAGAWVEVGRFGSIAEAQAALDEEAGSGHGEIGEYRVVPVPRSRRLRIGVILVGAALAGAWVWLAIRLFG